MKLNTAYLNAFQSIICAFFEVSQSSVPRVYTFKINKSFSRKEMSTESSTYQSWMPVWIRCTKCYILCSPASSTSTATFTLRLFSARLMTVTGKFQLPIGRISQSNNRQSEFSSHIHESRTKKSQPSCSNTL